MSCVRSFYEHWTRGGANYQTNRSSDEIELPYWSIAVIAMPRQAPKVKDGSVAGQQGHTHQLLTFTWGRGF